MCKLQCLISFTLCTMLVYCLLGKGLYPFIWHMFCHHSCLFSRTLFVNTGCLKWLSLLWTHLCRWYQTCKTVEFIHSDSQPCSQPHFACVINYNPPPHLPCITELVGVEGSMLDHPVCLSLQALSRRYLLVTILGMVVQHHEPGCHTHKMNCYL